LVVLTAAAPSPKSQVTIISPQPQRQQEEQKQIDLFDRKTHNATEGLQPFVFNYLKIMGVTNGNVLAHCIIAARNESNISYTYRKEAIKDLFVLSKFFGYHRV